MAWILCGLFYLCIGIAIQIWFLVDAVRKCSQDEMVVINVPQTLWNIATWIVFLPFWLDEEE